MSKSKLTKTYVVVLLAMLCCFLWGSAFPSIKTGYEMFGIAESDTFSQIFFAGIRFALAGFLVILAGSIMQKKFLVPKNKKSVGQCLVLACVQTVLQYTMFYIGLAHTSGVKGSVLSGMNVFFSLIVSSLIFRLEKLSPQKIIGTIIGFAGVVVINLGSGGFSLGMSLNGEGAIILSTLAYAVSSVLIKKYSDNENPVTLSGYQFFIGGIVMMIVGFSAGGRIKIDNPIGAFGIILYLALISAVAYTIWGILLKYNPVSKVSIFGFMNPVFGVLLSALVLGEYKEAFNLRSLLALVLVSIGIYIVNAKFKKLKSKNS